MAEGHDNTTISQRLFVTDNAVHKHIGSVFLKLGLSALRQRPPPRPRRPGLPPPATAAPNPATRDGTGKSPLPAVSPQGGGSFVSQGYSNGCSKGYFLPWFFTASIAAAAASGSR